MAENSAHNKNDQAVLAELKDHIASARWGRKKWVSYHQGYGILLEEVDEVWDEVKKKARNRDKEALRRELLDVAAMAVVFITDLLTEEDDETRR